MSTSPRIALIFCWAALAAITGWAVESPAGREPDAPVPPLRTEIEVRADAPIVEGNHIAADGITFSRVTRTQLDDLMAHDILTGVRRVPGILISRYNLVGSYGGGEGGTLFIRGMGSGRPGAEIQFLVDGVPRVSGVWAHPLMDVLAVDTMAQIDVVKGASPVLYGNMSFGAVDIRTRRMLQDGHELELSAAGGSYGTLLTALNGGFRQGRFDTYVSLGYKHSDGHRPQADGELQHYFGRLGYAVAPGWRLDLAVTHTNNYARDPGVAGLPPPPRAQFNTDDWLTVVTLENTLAQWDGYFRFYSDNGMINWQQWNTGRQQSEDNDTDYHNWGFRARQTWRGSDRVALTAGFDWDDYGGDFTSVIGGVAGPTRGERFRNAAPYALASAEFGDSTKIAPVAGLRVNVSDPFGTFLAPQAGVSLIRGGTTAHVSLSRGFNLPGVYAAVSYDQWGRGDAWRELEPERVVHLEAGVSRVVNTWLRLDATCFHDRGRDALRFAAPPPSYENIAEYELNGLETSVTVWPADAHHLFAAYTFLDAQPHDTPYAPRHTIVAGWNWKPLRRLDVAVDAQYIGRRFAANPRYPGARVAMDGFTLFNARLDLHVTPESWRERVTLFGAVENLTDTDYEYRPGYPMPGITLLGGLRVTIH
ncbi:MAG TPA: TonB-dependent receptor plug domain-containing protein [Acidobacteriota bacterium]|nr:TonB-dependent receptor plug domain-containing protein [Acidobacteriota bacterium]HQM62656.1 TonB-dependent receptor plug domain-containing protein [Acidobacteriota bacterium]